MRPPRSRRAVLAAGAATLSAVFAGCLDRLRDDSDRTRWQEAEQSVSYDHEVRVENDDDVAHRIQVTIRGSRTVFEETDEYAPGASREVFDFRSLAPDEPDPSPTAYTVAAQFPERDGTGESASIDMDECHGNVIVAVSDAGELQVIYSIC